MAYAEGSAKSQKQESNSPLTSRLGLPTSTQHMRVSNKATALRSQKMHLIKLENMKPEIDMKKPKSYPHVQYNAKRMQMEAERNSAIERENKILLGKMYTIMNAEPAYKTAPPTSVTSLNMTVRKQEYDRIARENQAIMQRILQREPHFNRAALDEDWKVTQRYLRNISEYPFILGNLPPATRKKTLKPIGPEEDGALPHGEATVEQGVEATVEQGADEDASAADIAAEDSLQAAAGESAGEEPPSDSPSGEEPAAQDSTAEEPTAEQPAADAEDGDDA